MQSDKKFEYLGEFDFIFEMNSGYESGDKLDAFDEKNRSQLSNACAPLSRHKLQILGTFWNL
jgi:hypothetical protein